MEIVLQIYHLDNNDEDLDQIVSILERKGLREGWEINKPTDETNSILVRYNRNQKLEPEYAERDFLFNNVAEFLMPFEKKQIDEVKTFQLGVMLKIVTEEFALPIPAKLLTECGRLGIDIYILYRSLK
ncbi:MAG: hypothetical protein QY306_13695 [Anaerolineales bacterium]|nr:MAG: hypothetical protein QY306_13695 [Anaerolineales bacterium]